MKTPTTLKLAGALLTFFALAATSQAQSIGPLVGAYAPSNNVFSSATAFPNDLVTFSNKIAAAFPTNGGGVFNMQATIPAATTIFRGTNNAGGFNKQLQFTSSRTMQAATYSGGTFGPSSSTTITTTSADVPEYKFTFGGVSNLTAGNLIVGENVVQVGLVIISRTSAQYPVDVRVSAVYTDGTTNSATSTIVNVRGTNVFYGFTAPPNEAIAFVTFESFSPGTLTPVNTRIGIDDVGLITGITGVLPAPLISGVSPLNYAITNAESGIQFQVSSVVNIDPTNISLVLNSINVSNQLVITGNSTNWSVAFTNLLADTNYTMVIAVTNSAGYAGLTQVFYTATSPFVLYDSDGFTNDTLYPLGNLQAVTDDQGTWAPHATEPSTILDVGDPQGKVLQRLNTGAGRADFLSLPPISSGTITIEFDAFTSTTAGRTIDVCIQPPTAGTTMGSFLAWGEVGGKLAYFDNVNWLPIVDWPAGWHHCKIINYLSGPAAGKYDVAVDGTTVAQRLPWRNAVVGTAFSLFRIQSQNTGPLFEYGNFDNLVITAGPTDTNVSLSPTIINITPANHAIIAPSNGIRFEVTSTAPIGDTNVTMLLNGAPVSLVITGSSTHLTAYYTQLTVGNYLAEISASNAVGGTLSAFQFIATDEAWLLDPADGWAGPWQWSNGQPELRTVGPIDGAGPYIRLDLTNTTARNFMRQYQSGTVDITKAHYIRWKFRLPEENFDSAFTTFNDRVHFFARNAPRLTASTDAANTWAISATGNEQSLGSGVSTNQIFYIFDNRDNTSAYNAANLVNSDIRLYPFNTYSFEVLVMPETKTYLVKLVNQTSNVTFTSSSPHKFRDLLGTGHTFLHFGALANAASTSRPFDLDSVFITQATLPVTLFNPVRNGNQFSFSFQSQASINYIVQYLGDITSSSWTSLLTNVGNGNVMTVTHTNAPPGPLYYRVNSVGP